MKKLFFAALVMTSLTSFADTNLNCVVGTVKKLGNFSYDMDKVLLQTEIKLKDTAVIVLDNNEAEVFNGEAGLVNLVSKSGLKGKRIYTLGLNIDDEDKPTGELALFTGTITSDSVKSIESDIDNSSINLFQNENVTSIDLEKGIVIHCGKQ